MSNSRFELMTYSTTSHQFLKDHETGHVFGEFGTELLALMNTMHERVVALTSDRKIEMRPPLANDPAEDLPAGAAVSNPLSSVSCSADGSLFAIDRRGRLWFTRTAHTSTPDWRQLNGPRG
jgi:hypothetical protein